MRTVLALGLIVVLLAIALWDLYCAANSSRDTVSRVMQDWCSAFPVLPFAVGLVMGHIFWQVQK